MWSQKYCNPVVLERRTNINTLTLLCWSLVGADDLSDDLSFPIYSHAILCDVVDGFSTSHPSCQPDVYHPTYFIITQLNINMIIFS